MKLMEHIDAPWRMNPTNEVTPQTSIIEGMRKHKVNGKSSGKIRGKLSLTLFNAIRFIFYFFATQVFLHNIQV